MAKQHSLRPERLRKGNPWLCKCRVVNLYEAVECKMIKIEELKQAKRQQDAYDKNLAAAGDDKARLRLELRKHIEGMIERGE